MDKKRNIVISTVVSVAVYFLLLFSLLSYTDVVKYSSKKSNTKNEIFIDITTVKIEKKKITTKEVVPKKNIKKLAKKPTKNIKNLFDDANITFNEENLFKETIEVQTRKKIKTISVDDLINTTVVKKSVTKNIIKQLENIDGNVSSTTTVFSDGVTDKYFEKVQQIVSKGWTPKASQKGMSLVVIFDIKIDGAFKYYIKRSSGDREFLQALKKHMQQLQVVRLPKPKRQVAIEINFIAKE